MVDKNRGRWCLMDYHYHFRSFKGKWAKHPGFSTLLDCHKVEDTILWSWLSQRNFIWDPWLQIFFLFRKIVVKLKSQSRCWLNNGGRHVCHSGMLFGGCSTIYTIYTILFIKKRKKNSLWWFDPSKSRSVRLKRHRKKSCSPFSRCQSLRTRPVARRVP